MLLVIKLLKLLISTYSSNPFDNVQTYFLSRMLRIYHFLRKMKIRMNEFFKKGKKTRHQYSKCWRQFRSDIDKNDLNIISSLGMRRIFTNSILVLIGFLFLILVQHIFISQKLIENTDKFPQKVTSRKRKVKIFFFCQM